MLGLAAWAGAIIGTTAHRPVAYLLSLTGGVVLSAVAVALSRGRPGVRRAVAALLLVAATAGSVAALHAERVARNPVAGLARERAVVTLIGTVTSDPRPVVGGPSYAAHQVAWRLTARLVNGRGGTVKLLAPVLVVADADRADVTLGETVRLRGRLTPAQGPELSGVLRPYGEPESVLSPSVWWRGAAIMRQAIRDSVAHRPEDQRALVPALVDGDDVAVGPELQDPFRTTGLTHLLAVSGTNLTLLVGFMLGLARWCRVRGRWLHTIAALGIVGFVLLARTEPSVLRAAVMGTVGLVALGRDGRHRALRGLGAAVVILVLVEPGLATSIGFALSVLATGGILLLAPTWRDALARWMPRWLAEAIAVPTAAQLACTPLVAAISGEVSLVAVAANLLVAPVVGPATVLGLSGGVLMLVCDPLGRTCGTLAAYCVAWIIAVARRGASLPTAAIDWGSGPLALALLIGLTAFVAIVGPRLIRHPAVGLGIAGLLVVVVAVRPPALGWPPSGWIIVACDVGQGDGLVLNAGSGRAVVVDAGPDSGAIARCLDRLQVREVPMLVLTHFHADHVGGIGGVLRGRRVDAITTTRMLDPPTGVRAVDAAASRAGVTVAPAAFGTTTVLGPITMQVLWPPPDSPTSGPGDGSTANEASVVLLVEIAGVRALLTGDLEPDAQRALARAAPGLRADVLKVPHHGSAHQHETWLLSLGAPIALVSVGAHNDYGHPAASALRPLQSDSAAVYRTDQSGDVAVVVQDGQVGVVTAR